MSVLNLENFNLLGDCTAVWGLKYKNWARYRKLNLLEETSYLLSPTGKETKVKLIKKEFVFRWRMLRKFEVEEGWEIKFNPTQINVGVFRFPLMKEGETFKEQPDILYNMPPEEVEKFAPGFNFDFKNTKIISFDATKIPLFCFEVKEIPGRELDRVKKEWEKEGVGEIEIEIENIKKFVKLNYENQAKQVKAKIDELPNYLEILTNVLLGKTKIEDAEESAGKIITTQIL